MNTPISLSLFSPQDAPDISGIYREIYGDDFPMKYVYDPEEITRRYDGVAHRAVVARDDRNRLAGVGSLFRSSPNPLLYEVGQLMVSRSHRNQGVAEAINHTLMEIYPTQIPVKGIFGEALCNHTISQYMAENVNMLPTGLELEWLPTLNFDNKKRLDTNISLLLVFRLYEDTPHTIYPHPAHAQFTEQRCRVIQAERVIQSSGAMRTLPETQQSITEPTFIPGASMAKLSVSRMGKDLPDVLNHFESKAEGCAMQVQLNIGDPAAPWAVDLLRGQGFFLGGYLPLWFETDGMLFQKLPTTPNFSMPRYASDQGRAVAEAVYRDWQEVDRRPS
ncbi:GNAT family N-acetyltransferase [Desulfogranum marinum]|uniref:GNAT family N-acetyltransferase n=1 Tax=Desulfogranum marinum TaxID=453220 RepID=UPI0019662EA5|nr:GNAT family N-acetyltransferase [Desulfogranum marinum]MBM9511237.1 GNAT family N-acetyltransferase [Desulfogranum marinum]